MGCSPEELNLIIHSNMSDWRLEEGWHARMAAQLNVTVEEWQHRLNLIEEEILEFEVDYDDSGYWSPDYDDEPQSLSEGEEDMLT